MSIEPRLTDGEVVQVIEGLEVGRLTGGVERAIADAATAKALAWAVVWMRLIQGAPSGEVR